MTIACAGYNKIKNKKGVVMLSTGDFDASVNKKLLQIKLKQVTVYCYIF